MGYRLTSAIKEQIRVMLELPESTRSQGIEPTFLPKVVNISSSFAFFHTKLHNTYPDS